LPAVIEKKLLANQTLELAGHFSVTSAGWYKPAPDLNSPATMKFYSKLM